MSKPQWVCAQCSMWSGRKSSVKRHIAKIHGGKSTIVSYIDYLIGRLSGTYMPGKPPQYISKEKTSGPFSVTDRIMAYEKGFWEEMGRKAVQRP